MVSEVSWLRRFHGFIGFIAASAKSAATREIGTWALFHQTPSRQIALLSVARARDSKVSLLSGYYCRRTADFFVGVKSA